MTTYIESIKKKAPYKFISHKKYGGREPGMGRTYEKVLIQSFEDVLKVRQGEIKETDIRTVEVEALVDTGAAFLCLPPECIEELGLLYSEMREMRTANGIVKRRFFNGANITIKGRSVQMSVMENDPSTPPLIGYLLLEALDYVVDPKSEMLIPNPENNDEWITDLL